MRGITHLCFAVFLTLILNEIYEITNIVAFLAVSAFFSLVPDIDESRSKLGRGIWPFSLLFRHRGAVHSLIFIMMVVCVIGLFSLELAAASALGLASHLALDALNHKGVRLLWPSRVRLKGYFKSGGIVDHLILASSIFGSFLLIL